eukprot:8689779-Alexandrium_andersonii.AAC.1
MALRGCLPQARGAGKERACPHAQQGRHLARTESDAWPTTQNTQQLRSGIPRAVAEWTVGSHQAGSLGTETHHVKSG